MIVRGANTIDIKPNGKEQLEKELNVDGFVANKGDIADYLMHRINSHWHDELELFVLDSGQVEIELNGSHFLLEEGDGCFVNQDILHSFEAKSKEAKFRSFVFQSSFVSGMTGSTFDLNYVSPFLKAGSSYLVFNSASGNEYFQMFNEAFESCESECFGYEFHLRYMLSKIMLYCSQVEQDYRPSVSNFLNDRVKKMMLWIDEHLEDEITIQMLAEYSNLCERECQRCFRKVLNCSPMEYVRRKRILKAAQMLRQTATPIVEIAHHLHFSNSSHFSKAFKEMVGCTPIQYRKQI